MSFPDPTKELILARLLRKSIEWLLAGATFALGLLFLLLDNVFGELQIFDVLTYFAGPQVWGAFYLILGTVRVCTLIVNGYWPMSPQARYWLSGITLLLMWMPICFSYAVRVMMVAFGSADSPFLPGAVGFPLIACFEALVMLTMRTWVEIVKKQYDRTEANG